MSKMKKTKEKGSFGKRLLKVFGKIILGLFLFSIFIVLFYKFVNPPISTMMLQRSYQQFVDKNRKVKIDKDWTSLELISPYLINSIVAAEDDLFFKHNGFNIDELKKSYKETKKGKRTRGGSTITMQTAKNLYLTDHRNYIRKGAEAYFTVLIEFFWSKERILEVYLNIIEFGDGIYGCEAAAQYYFKKPAIRLTQREAALLAACVPSPLKRNPAKPTRYINSRASQIQTLAVRANPYGEWLKEKKAKEKKKTKEKAIEKTKETPKKKEKKKNG